MRGTTATVAVAERPTPETRETPPPSPAEPAAAAEQPPRPAEPRRDASPAPAPVPASAAGAGKDHLLPAFPCRLVWSPRKAWSVETRLSADDLSQLFTEQLTGRPSLIKRFNAYHRRITWDVRRNAISGQTIGTLQASDLIPVGVGASKLYVDVNGDTLVLDTQQRAGATTLATVGVGQYTTWNGFYAFPATHHAYEIVRAIKRRDRGANVRYPWSLFRIAVLALITLWILIAMVSSSSGDTTDPYASGGATESAVLDTSSSDTSGSTEAPADTPEPTVEATPTEEATPEPTPETALPDASESEMVDAIETLLVDWHTAIVDGDPQRAWDLMTERKREQSERKYGFDQWATGQSTLAPHLDPSGLSVEILESDDKTGVVTVDVQGMRWDKPGAGCSTWAGITWVRYENGAWFYDPGYSTTPQRERRWKDRFSELLGGSC